MTESLATKAAREPKVRGAIAASVTSAALIAQQVAGKAVRDTLFLSSFEARFLPLAMGAAAILSLGVVLWLSRLLVRHSPAMVLPWLFAGSALTQVLCWGVGAVSPKTSALMVYFHTALVGPVLITAFWSLINERFDPHSGKRAAARIASGGTLGGVLGGLAAWRASSLVELPTMLLLLAVLNVACALGSVLISARKHPEPDRESSNDLAANEEPQSAFAALKGTPFLRNLGYLVLIGSVLSALLDYVFSAQAALAIPKGAPLLSFFSLFWLGVGIVSFVLQLALGRVALEKMGLMVSIAVLPGTLLLGAAFGLAVPGLLSAGLLRGTDAVQRNTLFRSAYELLYTPIPRESKRATKAIIDVGADRAGTLVGSLFIMGALHLVAREASTVLLFGILMTSVAALPIIRQLHRGYVLALEQSLRDTADASPPSRPTMFGDRPSVELDVRAAARDALIDRVQALGIGPHIGPNLEEQLANGPRMNADRRALKLDPSTTLGKATIAHFTVDQHDLLSGDVERARRVLEKPFKYLRPLVAFALPLLAHPELQRDAKRALSRMAPRITGQLIDILIDSSVRLSVRRRIPRVLAHSPTERAAAGLILGLSDDRFEIRYECSRALSRIHSKHPEIGVESRELEKAVLSELAVATRAAESAEEGETGALAAELIADRKERRLKHIFTVLSLQYGREPLELALKALHDEDDHRRGTALEYLETVLPAQLREALWPFLGAVQPLREPRSVEKILADLTQAVAQGKGVAPGEERAIARALTLR